MEQNRGKVTHKIAFVKVVLFTSKELLNGEHPVMIRIMKNRVRKYISIGISCSLKYWDKAKELPKSNHPRRSEIIALINKFEKEFSDKIQEFSFHSKDYTIEELVTAVLDKPKNTEEIGVGNVANYIDTLVATLKEENRMGTAKSNNDCKLMLFKFHPNKKLIFEEIDYLFLTKWESFMRKNNFKETSMAVYFRTIRNIINKAINEEIGRASCRERV